MPKELKPDALVANVAADPASAGGAVMFTGFLGRSATAGMWRIYTSPSLDEYYEVQEGDILHTQPLAAAASALGGSSVFVRKGATVSHTVSNTTTAQAEFLQGELTSGADLSMGAAGMGGMEAQAAMQAAPVSHLAPCLTRASVCIICTAHSVCLPCITRATTCVRSVCIICPTRVHTCTIACTHVPACFPTEVGISVCIACPSVHIPCQSLPACPSLAGCPSIACGGGFPGGGGDPGFGG